MSASLGYQTDSHTRPTSKYCLIGTISFLCLILSKSNEVLQFHRQKA